MSTSSAPLAVAAQAAKPASTEEMQSKESVFQNSSAAVKPMRALTKRENRASGIWTHWRCVLTSSSELSIVHVLGLAVPAHVQQDETWRGSLPCIRTRAFL